MNDESIQGSDASFRIRLALINALDRIFMALARIIVRHRIPSKVVEERLRHAIVRVAHEEHHHPGQSNTLARVQLLTGVHRQDVKAIVNGEKPGLDGVATIARVVESWRRDPRFTDDDGDPVPLPMRGPGPSFEELVRAHTSDVPARTMLAELLDSGTVEHDPDSDHVTLLTRDYVPRSPDDPHMLEIMGLHAQRFLENWSHNIQSTQDDPWYERNFATQSLPPAQAPALREALRATLDQFMDDVAGTIEAHEEGHRIEEYHLTAGIGVYYFEQ